MLIDILHFFFGEKSQKSQRLTQLCRVGITKNGGIKSDDLETGAISKYGLDVETIEIMFDGCLNAIVF